MMQMVHLVVAVLPMGELCFTHLHFELLCSPWVLLCPINADFIFTSYCGSTTDHCSAASGCQSGCTDSTSTAAVQSTTKVASTSTTQEPVIAPVTSTLAPAAASNAPVTTDGSCGVSNGGTVCGNWPNGNCCSMYGFW